MTDTTEKPNVDERYTRASNSSNLSVEARVTGDVDLIAAAAWSKNLIGKALMRLHSEFDGTSKPRPLNPRGLELLAVAVARERLRQASGPAEPTEHDRKVAREQAADWLLQEQKLMLGRLKTLPMARDLLVTGCRERWGWEDADAKVAAVLIWWLDRKCPKCHGTRFELASKRQGSRTCKTCHGSGERHVPCDEEGRQLAVFLDDCINRAKAQIARALRGPAKQA